MTLRQKDRAKELATGLSTLGSVLQYTGPFGALTGIAM